MSNDYEEVIELYKDIEGRIEYESDDDKNPLFRINIDGFRHSFSVKNIPKKNHEWVVDVYSRQFVDVARQARLNGRADVQNPIREALGFLKD